MKDAQILSDPLSARVCLERDTVRCQYHAMRANAFVKLQDSIQNSSTPRI